MIYDVIIVGAGVSGMTAACVCSDTKDAHVLVIEKNKKAGKKLYATGNGRCNISNSYLDLGCYNSSNEFFPFEIIDPHSFETVNAFMKWLGIQVTEEAGYFYPSSFQASTVVWGFVDKMKQLGVAVHTEETVLAIEKADAGYRVFTDKDTYTTKKLVLSCGGAAAPKLGGTKSGYRLLENMGILSKKISPALCKLLCREDISVLAGVRKKASVSICSPEGERLKTEEGELQFTADSLSGIVIFNLSSIAADIIKKGGNPVITVSLLNHMTKEDIKTFIRDFISSSGKRTVTACLNGLVNEKMAAYVITRLAIKDNYAAQLTNETIESIAGFLKNMTFQITGMGDFEDAQVTSGGIDTRMVKPENMELTMHEGMYVTGELLDVDGICGGYNLMWAVITGMKAGEDIREKLRSENKYDKN